ncbi:protein translocase subunit SecD [Arthrobacter castelli]|uniref:protein translocase subunit SecD n=1 Tax=Arthrobacter castelli TaxID=271431 RepID=UPI00040AC021|nr:protein translocase subunit SecD [Arthrobacter castelli]
MARTGPATVARRVLVWLGVVFLVLSGLLVGGTVWGNASWAPKLALDLEGGTQMILTPEVAGNKEITDQQLQQAVEIIRERVNGSGVTEAEITTQSGDNVVVSLPGIPSAETRELIQTSAQLQFRPVLKVGNGDPVPPKERTPEDQLPTPSAEPTGASDSNWIDAQLMKKYEALDCTGEAAQAPVKDKPLDEAVVSCDPTTGTKYILGPVEVQGDLITDAGFGQVQNSTGASLGQWAVNIDFNNKGTAKFEEVTSRLVSMQGVKNQFAIVLDGKVISAPQTNSVISNGDAQITGGFTEDTARALSEQLKYGALPISFDIQSERQISATLGEDQLRSGLIAGAIGLLLVVVYSLLQYRALGFVTVASLVVAGVMTYLAICILGWTENYRLSLAGVAGLIVAIGQTADSFIVYFERIRDELRDGRGLVSAVENGWRRAKQTVLASKAVNLLAAIVLYFVAVGNVRGFAFTLGLTAVADLIVVFMFTHPTLQMLARTRFFAGGHRLSGLDPERLGVVPLYRGAGRVRTATDRTPPKSGKNAAAAGEAGRRQTIAERRKAEAANGQESMAGSSKGSEEEGK